MNAENELLWDGLAALAERDPVSIAESADYDGNARLPERAAATPYLRRVTAVHRRAERGLPGADLPRLARGAASMHRHRRGAVPEQLVVPFLMGAALDAGLLRADLATARVLRGEEAWLVTGHPLAAWWESLPFVVYGDPLGFGAGCQGTAALLPLLYQYLVRDAESPLEPCVQAVHAEWVARADHRGEPPPRTRTVRQRLATLVALLEEFGVVVWRPEGNRLGTACRTLLGGFGWLLLMVEQDGPTPEVDELVAEAGYLPAAGGYVHRADLPVSIVDN